MYQPTSWDVLASWLAKKYTIVVDSPEFSGRMSLSQNAVPEPEKSMEELDTELREAMKPQGSQSGWDIRQAWAQQHTNRNSLWKRDDPTTNDTSPDYSFPAITCADAPDANYTTKDVFDELVRVTQQVSQVFGPQWGDVSYEISCLLTR